MRTVPERTAPKVYVVDDDVSIRESLAGLFIASGWEPVTFESATAYLNHPYEGGPSCLVLDVNLPDLNGLQLQQRITTDRGALPIIFMTGYGDIPMTVQAMKAGASEFLTKPFDPEVMICAVSSALDRSRTAQASQAARASLRTAYGLLTPREREVMNKVLAGNMNKHIASELGISEITVKAHRGKVMRKMRARSVIDLAHMAAELTK